MTTTAESAVAHILQRVANDRNLSYYTMGTQSLRLCLEAEAARTGKPVDTVEADLHAAIDAAQPRLENNGVGRADIVVLRERVDELERQSSDSGETHPNESPPGQILKQEQADGLACVVCGGRYADMVPISGAANLRHCRTH